MSQSTAELILVLDDEPMTCEAIRSLLASRGYRVVTATDCDEALRQMQQARPQLLLADVNLPCMSGFEFVQQLQRDNLLQDTPVIFVSAMARTKDIQAGLSLGAHDYLTKPFSPDELLTRVDSVLRAA